MGDEEYQKNRGVQTTVNLPFAVYLQVVKIAETEGVSFAEIVRRYVKKELMKGDTGAVD